MRDPSGENATEVMGEVYCISLGTLDWLDPSIDMMDPAHLATGTDGTRRDLDDDATEGAGDEVVKEGVGVGVGKATNFPADNGDEADEEFITPSIVSQMSLALGLSLGSCIQHCSASCQIPSVKPGAFSSSGRSGLRFCSETSMTNSASLTYFTILSGSSLV